MIYVLDACALIALFKQEQGAEKIEDLLDEADAGQVSIYMSTVNLIEVHYGFYRELGMEQSALILEEIYKLPIQFIDTIEKPVFTEASRLKALYYIPLGDAIGIATAANVSAQFVTSDHSDFDKIEKQEHYQFLWIR